MHAPAVQPGLMASLREAGDLVLTVNRLPTRFLEEPKLWGVLAVLLFAGGVGAFHPGPAFGAESRHQAPGKADSFSEVVLPGPKAFAVFRHATEGVSRLYAEGDVLGFVGQSGQSLVLGRITSRSIVLDVGQTRRTAKLHVGQSVPGYPHLVYTGSVTLRRLNLRYRQVDQVRHAGPILLAIEGNMAVLEKEVPRVPLNLVFHDSIAEPSGQGEPSSGLQLNARLFERIRVRDVDADTLAIDQDDLEPALDDLRRKLDVLEPWVEPLLSPAATILGNAPLTLESSVADAALGPQGVTITNLRTANFFGIQVGDTVTALNGKPVTTPVQAWWTLQELLARNNPRSSIRVDLIREGARTTKTYVIQ